MGNVFGAEKPSAYSMEYINIKTHLVQMQTAGQGVIETLKSYTTFVDYIIAEEECQAPKQKSKSKGQKNDSGQQYIRETRDSLQKSGLLHVQSILQSIKTLDVSIQTIVKQHFGESVHQSLEETWQPTAQNYDTSASISNDNVEGKTDDQVHGMGGPLTKNHGLATDVEKQQEIVSLQSAGRSLEGQIESTVSSVESFNKNLQSQLNTNPENIHCIEVELQTLKQQIAEYTNSFRSQLSSIESQNKELQSQLNTKTNNIQTTDDRLNRIEHQIADDDTHSLKSRLSSTESLVKDLQSEFQSIVAKLTQVNQQTSDDKNSLRSQLSTRESQNKELRAQLNAKTDYIQSIEAELQTLKQQIADDTTSFKSQLSSIESQNKDLQAQLSTKTEHIQSIEPKLQTLKQQTADDTKSFKSQLSSIESKNKELQSQLNAKTDYIKSIEEELQTLKRQTADDTNSFKSQLLSVESQNKELQAQLCTKTEHIQSIVMELQSLQQQTVDDTNSFKSQLSSIKNINKELQVKLKSSLAENIKISERQERNIRILKEKNHALMNTVQTVEKENSHLNEQLRRQRTVDLQIWFQRTDILTQVAMEIQEQVKTKCQQAANMVVNCFTPNAQADLQPCKPTLVLCINASRLGTDVSRALDNIQGSPAVAVVVLHHKAKHALPNQSSDKVLTSPEYKELGGVFDMAFLAGQGLYHCSMNDMALKKILEFLKYSIFQRELMK